MEKQLELKHLSVYLPYDLKFLTADKEIVSVTVIDFYRDFIRLGLHDKNNDTGYFYNEKLEDVKPILRPLSDFENFLDLNGDLCVDNISDYVFEIIEHINAGRRNISELLEIPYSEFEFLIKNHFDIFGLIESGLAIDINTLNTTENGSEIL